jgi:hypothetical protein
MKTLLIPDQDYDKALELLAANGIQAEADTTIPFLRRSDATTSDNPSRFGGIWAKDDRTLESIRRTAWPNRR